MIATVKTRAAISVSSKACRAASIAASTVVPCAIKVSASVTASAARSRSSKTSASCQAPSTSSVVSLTACLRAAWKRAALPAGKG